MRVTRDRFESLVRRVGAVLVAVALVATVAVAGGGAGGAVAVDGGVQPADGGTGSGGPNDVGGDSTDTLCSTSIQSVTIQPLGDGVSSGGPNQVDDD